MPPEAVIFDIGNVLIEWNPERVYDARIGAERRRQLFAEVPLHQFNDDIDRGANWTDTILAAAAAYPDWADEIRLWHDAWLEMASPRIDHSVRLMRSLRARGVPVHALTNFGIQTFDYACGHYDFLREFDVAFVSGHLAVIKPDPRIYQAVEQRLGLTGAALIFVDDRADNIAAAAARGWRTHLFTGPQGWADRLVSEGLLTPEQAQ